MEIWKVQFEFNMVLGCDFEFHGKACDRPRLRNRTLQIVIERPDLYLGAIVKKKNDSMCEKGKGDEETTTTTGGGGGDDTKGVITGGFQTENPEKEDELTNTEDAGGGTKGGKEVESKPCSKLNP